LRGQWRQIADSAPEPTQFRSNSELADGRDEWNGSFSAMVTERGTVEITVLASFRGTARILENNIAASKPKRRISCSAALGGIAAEPILPISY
jgi:hypothetical protein